MLEIRLLPALRCEDERRITMIIRPPISEKQKNMNIYLQGYEDGTDNFFNAICREFKL